MSQRPRRRSTAALMPLLCLALQSGGSAGCTHAAPAPLLLTTAEPPRLTLVGDAQSDFAKRTRILQAARGFVAGAPIAARGYTFSRDPVGFVRAAYFTVGHELLSSDQLDNPAHDGLRALFASVSEDGHLHSHSPRPADLVFFDRNVDGRDPFPCQVALVENVGPDGTIAIVGYFADGPTRIRLNLRQNGRGARSRQLNDLLRGSTDAEASALFRTFASPLGSRP